MNRVVLVAIVMIIGVSTYSKSQDKRVEEVLTHYMDDSNSLFERVVGVDKKDKKLNIYLNTKGSMNGYSTDGNFDRGAFEMDQFRIEAKGELNRWISFRWRQRLNRSNDGAQMIDNLPTSIDYAGIGVRLNKKFDLFLGKQGVSYGGEEYDRNPINVYEYSNYAKNLIGFATGIKLNYRLNEQHLLTFQILNSRVTKKGKDLFGVEVEDAKLPLSYSLLWTGCIGRHYEAKWSASLVQEAKGEESYVIALGNIFSFGKLKMYYDFLYSRESLDSKGINFRLINRSNSVEKGINAPSQYITNILNLEYRLNDKWRVFAKGIFETSEVYRDKIYLKGEAAISTPVEARVEKGLYSLSWTYLAGVEYWPFKGSDFHLFGYYSGRHFDYTDRAKAYGNDYNRVSKCAIGFVYLLPVF